MRRSIRSNTIIINGQRLHFYESVGANPDAKQVVILPGWGSEGSHWLSTIERLNARHDWHFYALDLPGFGNSPTPDRTWGLDDFVNLIEEFIARHIGKQVVLVGHSFGGQIATALTARQSRLIEQLILVAAASVRELDNKSFTKKVASTVRPIFELPGMKSFKHKILGWLMGEDYILNPDMWETMKRVVNEDVSEEARTISRPTSLVWGSEDQEAPLVSGQRLSRLIPNARLEVIPQAGHFPFIDKPDQFIKLFERFLNDENEDS